jgi:hypothetical protein
MRIAQKKRRTGCEADPPFRTLTGAGHKARTWFLGGLQLSGRELAVAGVALELVAQLLALLYRAEARTLDRRSVNENVRAAVVGLNEAEALLAVKPLNRAGSHMMYS